MKVRYVVATATVLLLVSCGSETGLKGSDDSVEATTPSAESVGPGPTETSEPQTGTERSPVPLCDPPLDVDEVAPPYLVDASGIDEFGAFTGCGTPEGGLPVLALAEPPSGWPFDDLEERLQVRYDALTTNKLGGSLWSSEPTALKLSVNAGQLIVDIPAAFLAELSPSSGNAWATTQPLVWTGFLEADVDQVLLTLDGDPAALAEVFQTDPAGTSFDRESFAQQLEYGGYRQIYEEATHS